MIIIGQIAGKEFYEAHFEIAFEDNQIFKPNYFIDRGEKVWIISCKENKVFTRMNYGIIPFWSKKRKFHLEAPGEGSEHSNNEKLKKRIILHPSYRRPIRESCCLIPIDYFILLSELKELYLFFSTESRPFALAALFDTWNDNSINKTYNGFSILTLPAGPIASNVGISRFPLILPVYSYRKWLKPDAHLSEITALLEPFDDKLLNGYPISRKLFYRKTNSKMFVKPVGNLLRNNERTDPKEIADFLKSFRYKRGLTHPRNDQDKRVWRGK